MNFTPEDFKPMNPVLRIGNQDVELSVLTLSKMVKFKEKYGELSDVYSKIKIDPMELIEIVWLLVKDRNLFNHNFKTFKNKYLSVDTVKISIAAMECLNDCVTKSMPKVINKKRSEDINKIKGSQTDEKPCYARYYDNIAKRYGTSLDAFYELTLRQISAILKTINDQAYDELATQAALQGKELKPRMSFMDISEEEEQEQDDDAKALFDRIQKEYEENQKNKDALNG